MKSVLEAIVNELSGSFEDLREKIQTALKEKYIMQDSGEYLWIKGTFPNSVVWEKETNKGGVENYISTYAKNEDGDIEILDTKEIELVTGYVLAAKEWLEKEFGSIEKAKLSLLEKDQDSKVVNAIMIASMNYEKSESEKLADLLMSSIK